MAKVKIQGSASGTGILTVTSPNTSTDRTITLPDATGTLLNSDGDGSSLTGVGGITNIQGFKLDADAAITGTGYLSSNWAAVNNATYGGLLTTVSQSSGTFSFSATGLYLVMFSVTFDFTVASSQDTGTLELLTTDDAWSSEFDATQYWQELSTGYNVSTGGCVLVNILNVDDTTNVQCRMGYGSGNGWDGLTIYGDTSDAIRTRVDFFRLGDSV